MGTKSIRNVLENTRILLIIAWFTIITMIISMLYIVSMGTNPNGESCTHSSWTGLMFYQMIWDHESCMYSLEYYTTFYSQFIPLYFLYDYVRRKIVGFNPNFLWRMVEVGAWFALNWGYLLWLTATDYGTLNWTMGWTSFVGTLLFFIPIILLTGGVRFLSNRAVLWIFFGILLSYVGLVVMAN